MPIQCKHRKSTIVMVGGIRVKQKSELKELGLGTLHNLADPHVRHLSLATY